MSSDHTPEVSVSIKTKLAKKVKVGIVTSKWNEEITNKLLRGAKELLTKSGVRSSNITCLEVPGSFELTYGAQILAEKESFDAIICLGCVIQGQTRHFDFICNAVANGITNVGIKYNTPVMFGVLTTDNLEQALDRSGGKFGNKGEEAAATALNIIQAKKEL